MADHLAGIRVLDLSSVLAGPFATYQMAQLGAEVIKVEVPDVGDLARQLGADIALNARRMGASFLGQNAGKKSIALNLKTETGRDVFKRLVVSADVVIENFRPGVMQRLGLSYDMLKDLKPDLIYCAITGFGQDGPLSGDPAYDQIVQGLAGVMSLTGEDETAPLRVGYPIADTIGGMTAAFAIAAALLRRERTGEGEFIDLSLLEATVATMSWPVSNWLVAGVEQKPFGNQNITASPSGAFKTKTGLLNLAANKQEQYVALCRAIGRNDLVTDSRFADREDRRKRRFELKDEIEKALVEKSAAEWAKLFNEHGVPAGEVLSLPGVFDHPQTKARAFVQTFKDAPGVDRPLSVTRAGFRLRSGDPCSASPPPELGAHTAELLLELGFSDAEVAALKKDCVV